MPQKEHPRSATHTIASIEHQDTRLIETYTRRPPASQAMPPGADELTPRESEIWLLIARGLSNSEIAQQLVIGEATVKTHVARVLTELGARDRIQAVVLAYEAGLV